MTPAEFRAARLSLGLTQAQLAAVMGYAAYNRVSPRDIEGGRRRPSQAAIRLLRALLDGWRPSDWPNALGRETRCP